MTNKQIFLQFDFPNSGAQSAPLFFSHPLDIITTTDMDDIKMCFIKIDQAIQAGYYVAGYTSYELAYLLNNLPYDDKDSDVPFLWFAVFEKPIEDKEKIADAFEIGSWQMKISHERYQDDFQKIQDHIKNNFIEEINYTVPFYTSFKGDSYGYYQQLQKAQAADYCAYLATDQFDILSASPELFFNINHDEIHIKPMKGTIHRGKSYQEDIKLRRWLEKSEKNIKENKLTTELMQEELEKVVQPNSIQAYDTYKVEKFPTVFQMTSSIKGKLQKHLSLTDVFKKLFPCSSIAGVPKLESMQLIKQLESQARGVYCGAIGYFTPNNTAVFNVPIRTVSINHQKSQAVYGAGGGITKASKVSEELTELFTKTNVLKYQRPYFKLLETLLLEDKHYFLLEDHLERLSHSAAYFNWQLPVQQIKEKLFDFANTQPKGQFRVRVTVSENNLPSIESMPFKKTNQLMVRMAEQPIKRNNHFLYHKTTYREMFKQEIQQNQDDEISDVLFWNEAGEITEFSIGNVVVEIKKQYYTPFVDSGLLPGTFRAYLLVSGQIQEKVLYKKDIENADQIWLINSVRKWVKVKFHDKKIL